eukprot:22774_1
MDYFILECEFVVKLKQVFEREQITMSSISFDVCTVELKLDAAETPYRIVSVPSFYTFNKLHEMIVWLFQWSDEHSHAFKIPIHKNNEKDDSLCKYYWVSNIKSFPSHNINIKKKLESRVMIQNALHNENDCIVYQYDFDSNINSNWTIFVTLLSKKSIHNFPIDDFDPFDFVEIIGGYGKTIPEYDLIDYDNQISEPFIFDEQEVRQYNQKRLNEELQIMRSEYTMFYEDYKKNKKTKRKMRQKKHKKHKKHKVLDVIHDDDDDDDDIKDEYIDATTDATTDATISSSSSENNSSSDEFLSTTESDIYHNKSDREHGDINDYDHILMYSNKKKTKKHRKRKQYLCVFLILFCIFALILYLQ